jgi:transposase
LFGASFPDVTTFDPTEKLLRAMLLQTLYSIRSERQLMEGLEFDLLFRWFVASASTTRRGIIRLFSKNRDRLLEGDVAAKLLHAVLSRPRMKRPPSSDHFSVDGTLIEAWALMKSFKRGTWRTSLHPTQPGNEFSRRGAIKRHARLDH